MNYEQKLKAAADFVFSLEEHARDFPPLNCVEIGISARLKPHQSEGVSWLIRRCLLGVNVVLGDEMGLGKTLQAITFLSYLKVHRLISGPFLIVCPLSVTEGWSSEFEKFCSSLKLFRYVGGKEFRRGLRQQARDNVKRSTSPGQLTLPFDVLLTTYDIVMADQDFLSQIPWHFTVIDEAQRLKNPSSVLYSVLQEHFLIPRRLLMTGTPIQNNLSEIWALMHFCMPVIFGTLEQFLAAFKADDYFLAGDDAYHFNGQFESLRYILKAFMLRRTKAVLLETGILVLPPLTEIVVMVPLVSLQKKVYASILRRELAELLTVSSTSSHQSLQNIVIQLRKACSHPYLFPGIEPEPYEEGEHLVKASGKLIVLDQLLRKLYGANHRVLLFAQMTRTLDILQDILELRSYPYERLDGSIRAEERFAAIRSFSERQEHEFPEARNYQGSAFVFLISTRAGGVGLNLIAADTVIFYEQDWNPQVDKQALQRAHRIGQNSHVLSINLVTAHTVEEVTMRRAERKLQLSHSIIGAGTGNNHAGEDIGISELRSLIFGLQMFDPTDIGEEESLNMVELDALSEKIIYMRNHEPEEKNDRKFEINPMKAHKENYLSVRRTSEHSYNDLGLDEASYLSWIEKFKDTSKTTNFSISERKERLSEEKTEKHEPKQKKVEHKKLAKWEAHGYKSLTIPEPAVMANDIISDSGSVQFVHGDCTKPLVCASEPTIIFSCVDNSGHWGHGGMFDALAQLSSSVPEAYQRASEFGDLHLGDLHLIKIDKDANKDNVAKNASQWIALAVVQSYDRRRSVPRSGISLPDLERCVLKASYAAAEKSASIHMPRIGYQDRTGRTEWYTVERLLHKYLSIYGIRIYVYYFRRSS